MEQRKPGAGDEARVVAVFAAWLRANGWHVETEKAFADVDAVRGGERLIAEAKGWTSSPGLDVDTLYGQLMRRITPSDEGTTYGVVVPEEARTAALRVHRDVLRKLRIHVYVVTADGDVFVATSD